MRVPRAPGILTACVLTLLSSSVTREDQRRINAFGRLNNRKQDVQAELAGKKARRGERRKGIDRRTVVLTLLSLHLHVLHRKRWRTWRRRATSCW